MLYAKKYLHGTALRWYEAIIEDEVTQFCTFKGQFIYKFGGKELKKESNQTKILFKRLFAGPGDMPVEDFIYEIIKINKRAEVDLPSIFEEVARFFHPF